MNWSLNFARMAGGVSLALGVIVLLGWYLHEPALIQVSPAFVPMQYNTALGFAFAGLSLLALVGRWPRFATLTGGIVLLTGILTLIEYIFATDLHIDQLFMEHYIDLKTSNPGRMAPNTALCFSLTGLTVLLATLFSQRTWITSWTATLGALIISLGITAFAGYMIDVEGAYGWGQMTRMAIHTAAGFLVLGSGFIALAWSHTVTASKRKMLPHWLAQVIGITGFTFTFALWQAMTAQEQRMVSELGQHAANFSDESLLAFGILLTLALVFKARSASSAEHSATESGRIYSPYVVLVLGALLATSLYNMLHTNFESSVKQRFESAAQEYTDAVWHGIDSYLETLYHIRSGVDASSFVDRNEFRVFARHSLERKVGIITLGWVPRVPAAERSELAKSAREEQITDFRIKDEMGVDSPATERVRDVYFPIYYAEPQETWRSALGYDLAATPAYLAVLNKAAQSDAPAVSARLKLFQSDEGGYQAFVVLPVYRESMPVQTAAERDVALRGLVLMVVEIGPMINEILTQDMKPAGLTLTFSDVDATDNNSFMYRHISRLLDVGAGQGQQPYLKNGLMTSTSLAFADQSWTVVARAANKEMYPDWDVANLWLPAGVMLLSFGLAWFLYRIKQTEAELAHSRMLMHAVLEYSPAIIYLKNLAGQYLMVNRVWHEASGVKEGEAIGETDYDIFPKQTAESFVANDKRVIEACKPISSEEYMPQKDGTVRTFMSYKFPVADSSRKVFAVGGVSSDITEIKQRERQYKALVDTIPGTVYRCSLDEHWTMLFISSEVEVLTGYPPGDFLDNVNRSFSSMIHPDDVDMNKVSIAAAIEAQTPFMIEYRIIHADGGIRYVYERGQAEYQDDGSAVALNGTIIDVTELKSLQADLEQARDDANAANQAKSAFLANMSHELRTPMNAILGYSEMLMEEAEDIGQEDFIPDLKKINQAGTHLLALINDVLDLSKIESGKIENFAEDFYLKDLIDEVSATAQPLINKNSNQLSIERGKQLGSACQDLTKVRQCLFNLLSNAAKFTHNGTITLQVNRLQQAGEDWLMFAVRDTGIGIAKEKLDQVFEEFTQADGSTTRDYGGTGLGLSISRKFCQLLGGDLEVSSQLGKGSTFTIRIPAVLPGSTPRDSSTQRMQDKNETDLAALGAADPGSMILVIDDDPEACEIIGRYLRKDGFSVAVATSGEHGLQLAHELQPAAITLDVMMPEMDGWSVLRALKADPQLHKIPVIMLSMIDERTRGYSLGAVDYLTKPVDRDQLHKVLARYYSAAGEQAILLVEDDIETRDIMTRTLEKSGWSVSGAENGKEALERMDSVQPKLILLDLMMPVMDGFGFLTALRARPDWSHIPVIVVTAKDLTDKDRNRLNGMVEEVLEKNAYTRDDLLERVREAVSSCKINN